MKKRTLISAGVISIFTLLSRIFGLVRDMVLASVLGAGLAADAFYVAFRIPNTFRRFFGEGAMTVSFVPIFTEIYIKKGVEESRKFSSSVFTLLSFTLLILTVGGIIFSPFLIKVFAPGFTMKAKAFSLAVRLLKITFPYIFLISLVALFTGILNSLKHFGAPAFSPVLFNISIILAGLLFASHHKEPAKVIAIAVIAGGTAQTLLQIPFLIKHRMLPSLTINILHPGAKAVMKLLLPAVFSAAIYQINILVITALASFLKKGSISYLYYAGRFIEFPLGILIFPITAVILPELSSLITKRNIREAQETLGRGFKLSTFLTLPATAGLIILSQEIIYLFLKGGRFSIADVHETAYALIMYSMGIVPIAISRLWTQLYYSFKDFKTPAFLALVSFIFNVELAVILMGPLRHGGLALSTSISSAVYAYLLARLSPISSRFEISELAKNIAGTIAMSFALLFMKPLFSSPLSMSKLHIALILLSEIVAGSIVYFISQNLLRSRTLKELTEIIRK